MWMWHLVFFQGFTKTCYLKARMCSWEWKEESPCWWISTSPITMHSESQHLSTLSTELFPSQFKKKPALGYHCVEAPDALYDTAFSYWEENFMSPRGLPDQSHQHLLSWQQTRTLFRARYFTYGQLYLSNKYMSTFILSREKESCMKRIMVSKILVHKYRRALKEVSHLVLLWLTIILLQFLVPFTGGTCEASRWN